MWMSSGCDHMSAPLDRECAAGGGGGSRVEDDGHDDDVGSGRGRVQAWAGGIVVAVGVQCRWWCCYLM